MKTSKDLKVRLIRLDCPSSLRGIARALGSEAVYGELLILAE